MKNGSSGSSPPAVRFTERLIWEGFSYGFGVSAADLDGDGFADLVVADTSGFVQVEPLPGEAPRPLALKSTNPGTHIRNSHLYWFKNDGRGNFTRHFIAENDVARRLERTVIADMNNDGRPDVVVVDNLLGDLLWYENPGPDGLKRGTPWKKHFITKGGMFGAEDLTVADFDGDGFPDVAAAGWRLGNCFRWFRNPGPGCEQEWAGWTIDGGFPGARGIVAGDIDGDGKPDLVATSDTSRAIIWYENPGLPAGAPWRRNVIDLPRGPEEPCYAKLADLNGDGRLDLVVASGGQWGKPHAKGSVFWYENCGKSEGRVEWKKHVVSDDFSGALEVAVADLNGDGLPDIVAAGSNEGGPDGGQLAWFENPGDPAGRWRKHVLKQPWPNVNCVIAVDLDNDGRTDLVAVADYGSMDLRWWHNEGRIS